MKVVAMLKIPLLSLVVALIPNFCFSQTAWLRGEVLDLHGAVVPGTHVAISSGGRTCETESSSTGFFSCHLPPGILTITATGPNMLPYRRAAVRVETGKSAFVVIRPIFWNETDVSIGRTRAREEEQTLPGGETVLIRFESSRTAAGKVVFSSQMPMSNMLTVGTLAVYVKEISCSEPWRVCTAKGAVTVELGDEQLTGAAFEVNLLERKITLTREPIVSRSY